MTEDDIFQAALKAGVVEEVCEGVDVFRFDIIGLKNFAALVSAKNPPQSCSIIDSYRSASGVGRLVVRGEPGLQVPTSA
jgi:hypothetical protein